MNAFGDILDEQGRVLAGAWREGEGFVDARRAGSEVAPGHPRLASNTTLAAVLTDARLTKPEAGQVARLASSGIARVIAPVHTPLDGDVTFVLGERVAAVERVQRRNGRGTARRARGAHGRANGDARPGCPDRGRTPRVRSR